jgi:hypothetical protein
MTACNTTLLATQALHAGRVLPLDFPDRVAAQPRGTDY